MDTSPKASRLGCVTPRPACVAAQHCGDLPPAVDPAQLNLPTGHEAEEQDQRRVFAGQRALRFHAAAEFFVESFSRVRGAQRLPLDLTVPAGSPKTFVTRSDVSATDSA
jgi:hypothetical protein